MIDHKIRTMTAPMMSAYSGGSAGRATALQTSSRGCSWQPQPHVASGPAPAVCDGPCRLFTLSAVAMSGSALICGGFNFAALSGSRTTSSRCTMSFMLGRWSGSSVMQSCDKAADSYHVKTEPIRSTVAEQTGDLKPRQQTCAVVGVLSRQYACTW